MWSKQLSKIPELWYPVTQEMVGSPIEKNQTISKLSQMEATVVC